MPPIKFRERLTKFMISIYLSEKFCCQNLITSIKVIINLYLRNRFLLTSDLLPNISLVVCQLSVNISLALRARDISTS